MQIRYLFYHLLHQIIKILSLTGTIGTIFEKHVHERMIYYRLWLILLHSEIDTLFVLFCLFVVVFFFWGGGVSLPFLRIFKSEFLIQGFISRQNLILGVDNQIQIKF